MNIIAIGDIHGTTYWKDIVKEHKKTDEDIVIFLGDYVDSYTINPKKIYQNLLDLFEYRKNTPNVFMLIGNHDYHYMKHDIDRYSGYNYEYAERYYDIFMQNYDLMNIAIIKTKNDKNIIFSHAGVSNTFLKKNNITLNQLNDLWKINPSAFGFNYNTLDIYGNHSSQSPLWIRPPALLNDIIEGYSQIIGHTQFKKFKTKYPEYYINNIIEYIDTGEEDSYTII